MTNTILEERQLSWRAKQAELVIQTLRVVRAHWQCSVSHRLRSYIHLVHSALLALMLLNAVL